MFLLVPNSSQEIYRKLNVKAEEDAFLMFKNGIYCSQDSEQFMPSQMQLVFVSSVGHMATQVTCENARALTLPSVTLQTVAEGEMFATFQAPVGGWAYNSRWKLDVLFHKLGWRQRDMSAISLMQTYSITFGLGMICVEKSLPIRPFFSFSSNALFMKIVWHKKMMKKRSN